MRSRRQRFRAGGGAEADPGTPGDTERQTPDST